MKKIMTLTLAAFMVAFVAGAVSAQTAAKRVVVVKPATTAQSKAAQKAAKKAMKEQEKAAKARAKAQAKAAKATARANAQTAKSVKTPVVTVRPNSSTTDVAAETNAFAAFESTFVAPDAVNDISTAAEQSVQNVQETEEVLSPSAPRS